MAPLDVDMTGMIDWLPDPGVVVRLLPLYDAIAWEVVMIGTGRFVLAPGSGVIEVAGTGTTWYVDTSVVVLPVPGRLIPPDPDKLVATGYRGISEEPVG